MPTEFMHAMYDQGGGAGLRDFWDRWMTNPMFAGGFIWVFCDEAPKRSDRGGVLDSDGSNAPDGVVGPRREKEGSFYAIRSQWSPVQIKPLLITEHFDGSFFISNEYIYTNLKDCRMTYEVLSCDIPMQGAVSRILARGEVTLPALSPGETGKARFSLPASFAEGDVLKLEAFDRDGHRICDWSFPIRLANPYFQRHLAQVSTGLSGNAVSARNNGKEIVLKSEKVSVTFDAATGMILRVLSGNTEIPLTNGPVAVGMKMVYQPASSYVRQDSEEAVFCARYKGGADSIVWRLTSQGLLYMDAVLLNRAWKNRNPGTNYGFWHKDCNNTVTGESYDNLVYPEFKGYHANMYWATFESDTAPFTVYSRTDGIFYRVFTPEEPKGSAKRTMPEFPEGDISFLLDIPAICSFKPIEQQGPNSQPGNIRIKKGDEGVRLNLMFDFRKEN